MGNMSLIDIAIEHTKRAGKSGPAELFTMHPFETIRGKNVGKYELLRSISKPGQQSTNQSAHVSRFELAELFARSIVENFDLKLRLRPTENNYPTDPPATKVPARFIKTGSAFDILVRGIDTSTPIGKDLADTLTRLNIHL
jgi:hypothetical protein